MERYLRQVIVRDFGGIGQTRIDRAHVALVGVGGIGVPVALYLAGAGVGKITIFEDDVVSLSNLHRQVMYRTDDVGKPKAEIAKAVLNALNPEVTVTLAGRFRAPQEQDFDLLIDGTDNLATRHATNRYMQSYNTPLLSASIAQWEGQIAFLTGQPCYACLYSEDTDVSALPSCAEAGVVGAAAGMIGTMTAVEAIKIITNANPMKPGEMLLVDGKYQEIRRITINPRSDCQLCQLHA